MKMHLSTTCRPIRASRRQLLMSALVAAAAAIAGFGTAPASAQNWPATSFRLTMTVSPSEPLGLGVQHFMKRLSEETGGKVKVNFFPSGQLGQDLDVFEQLSEGTVHMHASGFGANANYNSFYAPWLFKDFAHVQRVLDSDLAKKWNDDLIKERGVAVLTAFPRAPRQISSNGRPVRGPADLKGLRMRVPEIPILFNAFQQLGADPVSLNFGEVYTALQTGTIQAQENPLPTIAGFSLQEVQKYISLTEHVRAPEFIYVNSAWWNKLTPELRALMLQLLKEGQDVAGKATDKVQTELIEKITAAGRTEIVKSDVEALRAAAKPVLDVVGPQYMGKETYQTIVDLAN
jgi:tripartite ATP-independent transporter DctP family solute receptor